MDERHPLERLLAPFTSTPIADGPGEGDPVWLTSGDWRIFARPRRDAVAEGAEIESFRLSDGSVIRARWDEELGAVSVPFSLAEAYENYVSERWRTGTRVKQLTANQLSLFYRVRRLMPRRLQLSLRRALVRWQGLPEFPVWPLDESVLRLVRFYAKCLLLAGDEEELRFRWFWPDGYTAALILTHDVESEEGLRLALRLADAEEERGFRSSFNIVTSWYSIDFGIVRELQERGFEIGLHGVFHDRSMFSSRIAFDAQQPALEEATERFQAEGFRSPATYRVFEWLADLPVSYDCSIPHSDPFEPQPGGCCSVWPFFIGDVVELPYTLPQDHTLFTLLRHRSPDLWLRLLERIEEMNGLAQVLAHPDPGYMGNERNRALYTEFLDRASEHAHLWTPLPRDVGRWWRERDAGESEQWRMTVGAFRLERGSGELVLEPQAAYL